MQEIVFSRNWNNKLNGDYIPTVRPDSSKFAVGSLLQAVCREPEMKFLTRVDYLVKRKLADIPDHELVIDTGLPADQARKTFQDIYKNLDLENQVFVSAILKRMKEEDIKAQEQSLLTQLDRIKHPAPEKKEFQLNLIKEISQSGKVAFLDTETTGFEGEVIELSILGLDEKVLFNELIKPVKHYIHPAALSTHGITLNDLSEKQNLHYYKYQLKRIFEEYLIVIYNAEFDMKILRNSFKLQEHLDESMEMIDLDEAKTFCLMNSYAVIEGTESSKAYSAEGFKTWKLTEACRKEGVDISGIKAHRALADCEITRQLFMKLEEKQ